MPHPRLFDHDQALARLAAGESGAAIAASYGVTASAIYQLAVRNDPVKNEALKTYHRERQQRTRRKPCVRGCGRLAWNGQGREGVCSECRHAEQRAEAEARDNHGTETRYGRGCKCPLCRQAATDAKRRRREAGKVPCSHGCGTMVNGINRDIPDKPPECHPCAIARSAAERRATRKKLGVLQDVGSAAA